MISESIKNKIERVTGDRISGIRSITGGCISMAFEVTLKNGTKYFLKLSPECRNDMFLKEANGLKELRKAGAIRVPEVILADSTFLLLEKIETASRKKNFFSEFGIKFSQLHRTTSYSFGFYEDNFIGSNVQLNLAEGAEKLSWPDFYMKKRILFQYRLAEENGYGTPQLGKIISKIETRIYDILAGSEEPPSLLHGDLWSGNFITDETGAACLIDPAVYYGHREADLAMTKLFGGFSEDFYSIYHNCFPLAPGHNERENIYKLYHALNHLNLFGISYYNQTLSLAKSYI